MNPVMGIGAFVFMLLVGGFVFIEASKRIGGYRAINVVVLAPLIPIAFLATVGMPYLYGFFLGAFVAMLIEK